MSKETVSEKEKLTKIMEDVEPYDPIQGRIRDLEEFGSTTEAFSTITSTSMKRKIAQASLSCEVEATKVVSDVQYVENINEMKDSIIIKGEEEIEVPKLEIIEMKVTDSRTDKIESVRFGVEALLTNHRLIFLDVTADNYPKIDPIVANKVEVSHIVSSNLTYYPVSLTEVLGLSCDLGKGTKTSTVISRNILWPISILFAILGIALGAAVNWFLLLLMILGVPFIFLRPPSQGQVISMPTQKKQLKLAIIDPETKRLSKLTLELHEEYPVPLILKWIKEIQRRCPLLHETIEITKNININLS